MEASKKIIGTVTSAALALGGAGALVAAPFIAVDDAWADAAATQPADADGIGAAKAVRTVLGQFSFDQATITPNSVIKNIFQKAAAVLCDGATELTVGNADDWEITVSGDVAAGYTATLGDLAADNEHQKIMGCTCASNTAGGTAAINAEVTGVPLAYLIERALPAEDANTVTLVSEDGLRTALPLDYVMARDALVTYRVNDEALSESVGGTNQLWIDSAAAKYFSRNIVAVEITCEDEVPVAPGDELPAEGEYVNRPNVGVQAVS